MTLTTEGDGEPGEAQHRGPGRGHPLSHQSGLDLHGGEGGDLVAVKEEEGRGSVGGRGDEVHGAVRVAIEAHADRGAFAVLRGLNLLLDEVGPAAEVDDVAADIHGPQCRAARPGQPPGDLLHLRPPDPVRAVHEHLDRAWSDTSHIA